jgi:hypothetical protein
MSVQKNVNDIKAGSALVERGYAGIKQHIGRRRNRDAIRVELLPYFGKSYGVAMVAGAEGSKAEGTKVLDSSADSYEACRKALSRTLDAVLGVSATTSPKPEFTRKQITEAKRFLSLFESKTLAKQALEQL